MNAVITPIERDMNKEAWLWYHLTSVEFAQAARQAMQDFVTYYIEIAEAKGAWGTGRTDQIAQYMARFVREYDAAIELMKHGDYRPIWNTAHEIRGAWSGISHSVLPLPWLSREEHKVFDKISDRTGAFASVIRVMLNNAFSGGHGFLNQSPEDADLYNRDDGPICADILLKLSLKERHGYPIEIPTPTPQFDIDYTRACKTGETVPWTGVWYPETGLDRYSLAFAIKGQPMQPAYHVDRTAEDARQEAIAQGLDLTMEDYDSTEITRAVPTTWHPLIPSSRPTEQSVSGRLRALPNEIVPRTGWWWSPAFTGTEALRHFNQGEHFPSTETTGYGGVFWYYEADRQPKE